jgi:hypothetical protein
MTTMRAISKRLQRLEKSLGSSGVENQETPWLQMRLTNARLRCKSPQPSPEHLAGLTGMTIVQILHSGRQKSAGARVSDLKSDAA